MAIKSFYLTATTNGGWRTIDEATQTAATNPDGWVVSTGATLHSEYEVGVERAATTFVGTTVPDGTLDTTLKDAFRSTNPITGAFDAGTWTFNFVVRGVTTATTHNGRIRFRLIKANADGSGATEITSAQQQGSLTGVISNTTSDFTSTLSFNPGAFTMAGQYLFVQVAWERTVAGAMTTADVNWRTGSTASVGTRIATATFTLGVLAATIASTAIARAPGLPFLQTITLPTVVNDSGMFEFPLMVRHHNPKPAAGTPINASHPLYASLLHAWAFLEGTGTTSADSKGTNGLTLASSGLWGTDLYGPVLRNTVPASVPAALASAVTLAGTTDFSFAWRCVQNAATPNPDYGMIFGRSDNNSFSLQLQHQYGTTIRSAGVADIFWWSEVQHHRRDFVLTYTAATNAWRLFVDWVEDGANPIILTGGFSLNAIGRGGTVGFAFYGDIAHVYVWSGRVLSDPEILTLFDDPYGLFTPSASQAITGAHRASTAVLSLPTVAMAGSGNGLLTSLRWHYKFDEASGQDAVESFGKAKLLNFGTVAANAGVIGTSRQSMAVGDYLANTGTQFQLTADQPFTISIWAYLTNVGDYRILYSKFTASPPATNNQCEYRLMIDAGAGNWAFCVGNGSASQTVYAPTPSVNAYHHILVWHDPVADLIGIQVDDGTVTTAAWAGGTQAGSLPLYVFRQDTFDRQLAGLLDEFVFFDAVLTPTQRSALNNGGDGLPVEDYDDGSSGPPADQAVSGARVAATSVVRVPLVVREGPVLLPTIDATTQLLPPTVAFPGIVFVSRRQNTVTDTNLSVVTTGSGVPATFEAIAGNLLVACVNWQSDNGATGVSITDTAGNTYVYAGLTVGTVNRCELWYAENCLGHAANVVTATLDAPSKFFALSCLQFMGVAPTSAHVGNNASLGIGTAITSDLVPVYSPQSVIVAMVEADGQELFPTNDFIGLPFGLHTSPGGYFLDEYKIVTADTAATAGTLTTGAYWQSVAASFVVLGGGPSPQAVTSAFRASTAAVFAPPVLAPTWVPSAPIIDTFNRADETPLGAPWVNDPPETFGADVYSGLRVVSNQLAQADFGGLAYYARPLDHDFRVSVEVPVLIGHEYCVVAVGMAALSYISGGTFYGFELELNWWDAPVYSEILQESGSRLRQEAWALTPPAAQQNDIMLEAENAPIIYSVDVSRRDPVGGFVRYATVTLPAAFDAGDAIGLSRDGTTLMAWVRHSGVWRMVWSGTDTYQPGPLYPMVFSYDDRTEQVRLDNLRGGPWVILGVHVGSTAQLFAPTVSATAGVTTITAGTVASTASLFAPSITVGAVTVTAGTIASTTQVFAPIVALAGVLNVTLPLIASTAVVRVPSVTTGPVAITTATIGSTVQVFAPAVVSVVSITTAFIGGGSGGTIATAYTNSCGSGNRTALVLITTTGFGTPSTVVNGNLADTVFFFTGSGNSIEFWFPAKKIIDEAKFYQSGTNTHGTWKWQGSNDRTSWTDLGATFTLGGATTQTFTTLAGNSTAYIFYRLLQVSGTASSAPWIHEFEFKIDEAAGAPSYLHALGSGDRTATIAIASSGIAWATVGPPAPAALVNGSYAAQMWWDGAAVAGHWVRFDLGTAVVVQQARFFFDRVSAQGDWKLQGSADASAWTDLSPAVTLGVEGAPLFATALGTGSNTTPYRYYRLLGVSGSRTTNPYLLEVEFMVGAGVASGGGAQVFAPTLQAVASGATIPTTAQCFAPSVTTGPVSVILATIPSTLQVFAPTVGVAGTTTVLLPFLAATTVLQAPSVAPGAIAVVAGTVASTALVRPPSVTVGPATVVLAFRSPTSQAFAPTVVPPLPVLLVTGATIGSTVQVFAPRLAYQVLLPTRPGGSTVYPPRVQAVSTGVCVSGQMAVDTVRRRVKRSS